MATVVVEAAEPELSGGIANPAAAAAAAASTSPSLSHRFLDSKFYLLVVVGEIVTEEHLRRAIGNIELGKRPRGMSSGRRTHAATPPRAQRPPLLQARPAPTDPRRYPHTVRAVFFFCFFFVS